MSISPRPTGVEANGLRWRGLEVTRLEQFSDAVFAFALALIGPPWMMPVAGFIYVLIGPAMWLHWRRVEQKCERADRHRRIEDHLAGDEE